MTVILLVDNREDLDKYETECIRIYDTFHPKGYNHTTGGRSGFKLSQVTKDRHGQAIKGIKRSAETKRKISEAGTGKFGESHNCAILTNAEASIIKHSSESARLAAARFGVSTSCVKHIRAGRTYRNVL